MPRNRAFTATAAGLSNVLISPCKVGLAGANAGQPHEDFQAIWDTGATNSVITQNVVDKCELKPIGRARLAHAGVDEEPDETDVYLIDLGLPNGVVVQNVPVSRSGFSGGDVLIGMDIINTGDFAITHANGQTKFTFQYPAQADIDFVEAQPLPPPRNRAERRAGKQWRARKRRGR